MPRAQKAVSSQPTHGSPVETGYFRLVLARLFVALYCTRMRGGYLRFQAQYLRKIRLPRWSNVNADLRQRLVQYAETKDRHALNEIVSELYGLSPDELKLIERNVET